MPHVKVNASLLQHKEAQGSSVVYVHELHRLYMHVLLGCVYQSHLHVAACCRRIIRNMYQRLSYLRNPRYAAQSTAPAALPLKGSSAAHRRHGAPLASSTVQLGQYGSLAVLTAAAAAGIGVYPSQGVLFDAYEPGGVYLQTVQLQNTGTVMRQLRLLPPSSRYFQVSFPRQANCLS